MASSSSVSSTNRSSSKTSRFSTLKVFKFNSKERDLKPPPLPPKDHYYLQNKSLASLSPDSLSLPPSSPLSPRSQTQYAQRPPQDPNHSTMSLVSSAASIKSSPAPERQPQPQGSRRDKALGFLKFAKRSPKALPVSSPGEEQDPPPEVSDEGISMPWNFQHNIHVDEGYVGLPPSWTTSLVEAGFSEDEIAAIHARRMNGTRSPGSQYLYTDRPNSPALNPYAYGGTPQVPPPVSMPILTNPTPRSTSLPRQYSDKSLTGAPRQQRTPPVTTSTSLYSSPSSVSLHSKGGSTRGSIRTPPRGLTHDHHPSSSSMSFSTESHQSADSNGQDQTTPMRSTPSTSSDVKTPPRKTFRIVNVTPKHTSPPPIYNNPFPPSSYDRKEKPMPDPPSTSSLSPVQNLSSAVDKPQDSSPSISDVQRVHKSQSSTDTTASRATSSSTTSGKSSVPLPSTPSKGNRMNALPPRLSLHQSSDSTDLSSWSQAFLSGITSANSSDTQPHSAPATSRLTARPTPTRQQTIPSTQKARIPPPTRPIPPSINADTSPTERRSSLEDTSIPSSSGWATVKFPSSNTTLDDTSLSASPLWNELEGILRGDTHKVEEPMYSAALTGEYSPIIPATPDVTSPDRLTVPGTSKVTQSDNEATHLEEEEAEEEENEENENLLQVFSSTQRATNRDSSRSSSSTLSTSTVTGTTIVRNVSVVRRTGAYVIDNSKNMNGERERFRDRVKQPSTLYEASSLPGNNKVLEGRLRSAAPPSPLSSHFGSEEESLSGSGSSSSQSQDHPTPITEVAMDSPLNSPLTYYPDSTPSPDPSRVSFVHNPHHVMMSMTDRFGGKRKPEDIQETVEEEDEDDDEDSSSNHNISSQGPNIVISDDTTRMSESGSSVASSGLTSLSPHQKYPGWLSEVVAPLNEFIDDSVDPRKHYEDLQEIAEGESGSVFAGRLVEHNAHKLKLPPLTKAKDSDDIANGRMSLVAIKHVAIVPSGSQKLVDLEHELVLMRGLTHENILGMDALYVDLVEDSLWIRMELMERSLADIVGLVGSGLMLQDRMIARFASDVVNALDYLQQHNIAHRDVRSDNLLLNSHGFLKLTDFSNAVQVTRKYPMRSDAVGVVFWQAPEMRTPLYNALRVDVWSLGATVWEMAQTEPPFSDTQQLGDRWPPLRHPESYSPAFHNFLTRCSDPPASRPSPSELAKSSFVSNACGRLVIQQLLSRCMAIERLLQEREADM